MCQGRALPARTYLFVRGEDETEEGGFGIGNIKERCAEVYLSCAPFVSV